MTYSTEDNQTFTMNLNPYIFGKIMKDMWDKNGQFYEFVKDKVDSLSAKDINDYLDQCLDDDRCTAEFASYIAEVIGRNNFSIEQVQKFINTEDLKG